MQTLLPISLWITAAPYGCSASLQMEADRISAYTMKSLVPGLRVLVLGDNQAAVNPVREALQRMDGTLVASSHHLFVAEYKFDLMQSQRRQVALPQIGRQSGADLLVLVDADQRINFPRVVKGIDAETGEILWNGSAARPRGRQPSSQDAGDELVSARSCRPATPPRAQAQWGLGEVLGSPQTGTGPHGSLIITDNLMLPVLDAQTIKNG